MNINFTDLEKLIKIAENSNINALEVVDGQQRIHIICRPHDNEISNNGAYPASSDSKPYKQPIVNVDKKRYEDANIDSNIDKNATSEVKPKDQVVAPMLGTFYRRSEPTADEFVKVGDKVDEGQTLCIIEAMKMMYEVKADFPCTIKDALVDEGDVVEYGQPLFIIEPTS